MVMPAILKRSISSAQNAAHSTIRKLLSIAFHGETLDAQLVATDIKYDFHAYGFHLPNFVIDPVDYVLIARVDNEGLWRVSYGASADMSEEKIHENVHRKLEKMLPDGRKSGNDVSKVAPYKAQQRCAENFWKGRVGICGDAAHLTNPYAGLGLASGIAGAASLSAVLIHILTGKASSPPILLTSWAEARRQMFLTAVDKPSRMAYARVRSKFDTQEDLDALLLRDPLIKELKQDMPMIPPSLDTICADLKGW